MKKRIGILTSGGDCPGLNAVIRGAVKSCQQLGYDCIGFLKGYEGLSTRCSYFTLTNANTTGILNQGGTILGSTNKGRFAATVGVDDRVEIDPELLQGVQNTVEQLEPRRPDLHRRRWLAGDRPAVSRVRHSRRRRAEDDRQRPVGDGASRSASTAPLPARPTPSTACTPPPPATSG